MEFFIIAQTLGILTLLGSGYCIPRTSEKYLWVGLTGLNKMLFQISMSAGIGSYLFFIHFFSFGRGKKYFQTAPEIMTKITLLSACFMLSSVIWAPATYLYSQYPSKKITEIPIIIFIGLLGTALSAMYILYLVRRLPQIESSIVFALGIVVCHTLFGDAIYWFSKFLDPK